MNRAGVKPLPSTVPVRNIRHELSIVVPVYNEGCNILTTLRQIEQHVRTPHQVLLVYDHEEDDTLPVVRPLLASGRVRLVKNRHGRGALAALRTGLETASSGLVLVMMADASDDPTAVDRMVEEIDRGCHVVCGSRYMRGGRQIGGPRFKKMLSRVAGVSLYYLAGLPTHDVTNSFKLYRKELLSTIRLESTGGFEIGMEIVVKAFLHGYRIGEVPSTWHDRSAGQSRFQLRKWLPKYLRWYWYALRGRWWAVPAGGMHSAPMPSQLDAAPRRAA